MVINKKNGPALFLLLAGGFFAGLFAWELLERLVRLSVPEFTLSTVPLILNLDVLAIAIKLNPGTVIGMAAGGLLFKTL
jgi:hypothetical protein